MISTALTISTATQRRFILGKQGLWPGRRWQGAAGVIDALNVGCVVQVDPLNVVARSHDIVLYGRVLDYSAADLDALLYTERACFDYGGTVLIHPMAELPYWRVVMARKGLEPRRVAFAAEYEAMITAVRAAIEQRGPLGSRDFAGAARKEGSFRSGKDTGQALYYLWLAGELMTHSRRGFERVYDLRERIAPAALDYSATAEEADDYFARRVFPKAGLVTQRSWRNWFAGTLARPVTPIEARTRFAALQADGTIVALRLETEPQTPRFILAADLPLLEALQHGSVPAAWQPLDTSTADEMVFLAPLEIVSTRGRALPLFGFEYLWEVYKPAEKRRWGYYTLPILYGDRLVARLDPKLDRMTGTLHIKGFWLEADVTIDAPFVAAFVAGLRRFLRFVGATNIAAAALPPAVQKQLR